MAWRVRINESALKELSNLDKSEQKIILTYLRNRIELSKNPRLFGKALRHTDKLWRYRVGKYRLICLIQDQIYTVLVLIVGKRDKLYNELK